MPRSAFECLERGREGRVSAGKNNTIAAPLRWNGDRPSIETPGDTANKRGEGPGVVAKVGDQQAAGAKAGTAAIIEGLFAQGLRQPFAVESINEENVGLGRCRGLIIDAVGTYHAKPTVVRRDFEFLPQGDNLRINLDNRDIAVRQAAVTGLGQRSTPESDHLYTFGLGSEQPEAHHHARIVEQEVIRIADTHGALNGGPAEQK